MDFFLKSPKELHEKIAAVSQGPLSSILNEGELLIKSDLPTGSAGYYYTSSITLDLVDAVNEFSYFSAITPRHNVSVVTRFLHADGKVSANILQVYQRNRIPIPENAVSFQLGFRITGPGTFHVKDFFLGNDHSVATKVSQLMMFNEGALPATSNTRPATKIEQPPVIMMETVFCDTETSPHILDRYFSFLLANVHTLSRSTYPDWYWAIYISSDKIAFFDRLNSTIQASGLGNHIFAISFSHPEEGYGNESEQHIDRLRRPNSSFPYRRQYLKDIFVSTVPQLLESSRLIARLSLDDDDFIAPEHFWNIALAAEKWAPLLDSADAVAIGFNRIAVSYFSYDGNVETDDVEFTRILTGNKFYIANDFSIDWSAYGIPETFPEEMHSTDGKIIYRIEKLESPTFSYNRHGDNFSGSGKATYYSTLYSSAQYTSHQKMLDGFLMRASSPTVTQHCLDCPPMANHRNFYDLSSWNEAIYSYDDLNSFLQNVHFENGIHRIALSNGQWLDLYISGLEHSESHPISTDWLLVGFSGAITNRKGKKAPFFSGISLAAEMRLPLVAVADPTLSLDGNLALGWYAGTSSTPMLPTIIALALDRLSELYSLKLLLMGGSGGGFASLMLSSILKSSGKALVWNPQTDIADYVASAVEAYLNVACPNLNETETNSDAANSPDRYRSRMDAAGLIHSVRKAAISNSFEVLYLQNRSDWHVLRHAGPYMAQRRWTRNGDASFVSDDRCTLFLGNWGQGHAVPPKELLVELIRLLTTNTEIKDVVTGLQAGNFSGCPAPSHVTSFIGGESFDLSLKTSFGSKEIKTSLLVRGNKGTPSDVKYAFYLYVDGVRSAVAPYQDQHEWIFMGDYTNAKAEVVAFVQDAFGNKLSTSRKSS